MALTTLFIDLNAYFASVEQQLQPELRGKPVAVVPIDTPAACCIAASYEAKRVGVKTGMIAREAKQICPEIHFALARPEAYVRVHHEVLAAAETCLPIGMIHSIDEFSCRLWRGDREPEQAMELAKRIKKAIRERVGECMRCSIGIAPNRLLAKIGTDMQKPDGLVVIEQKDLPHKLHGLDLEDLAGIGPRMRARLESHNICTVEDLCSRSARELEKAWGSVVGRRWWHWLRGEELDEWTTHRRSIGHQHVLAPEMRTNEKARGVAIRLLHKAAARARHMGYLARRLSLWVGTQQPGGEYATWGTDAVLDGGCSDTFTLVEKLTPMWDLRPPHAGPPKFVGVTLHDLVAEKDATLPLFGGQTSRAALSRAMDRLDRKYGRLTVYSASMHDARDSARGGIAFSSVPDLALPDTVSDRMR